MEKTLAEQILEHDPKTTGVAVFVPPEDPTAGTDNSGE